MAYPGKQIHNPITRQSIQFLKTAQDTGGQLLEMVTTYDSHSAPPSAHYHPYQEEDFVVLEGQVTVQIGKENKVLNAGDTLHIPRNTVHAMWNAGDEKAVVNWQVRPAMDTEYLLETGMGLAAAGKTDQRGRLHRMQAIMTGARFASVYRLPQPPYWEQLILFTLIRPIAWLRGFRATYPEYLD